MNRESFLEDLRQDWQDGIKSKEGANCPCCGRFSKVYKRTINRSIAQSLRWMYQFAKDSGVDAWAYMREQAPQQSIRANEYTKLLSWGLAEKMPSEPNSKKKSTGMYRITQKGIDFVEHRVSVPKYVFINKNEVLYVSEELTDFTSCLGEYFDYQDLMNS